MSTATRTQTTAAAAEMDEPWACDVCWEDRTDLEVDPLDGQLVCAECQERSATAARRALS